MSAEKSGSLAKREQSRFARQHATAREKQIELYLSYVEEKLKSKNKALEEQQKQEMRTSIEKRFAAVAAG